MEFETGDINLSKNLDTTTGLLSPSPKSRSLIVQRFDEDRVQELIILNNQRKMKRLEVICVALSATLTVLYNLMPLIVTMKV